MRDLLSAEQPMTVRQVFYRLVSMGVIDKTEGEYKRTVVRLLGLLRRGGAVPYGWIADNTRWMRKPRTYGSLHALLESSALTYRRAVWDSQDAYVEVWLEKEALAGVLYRETERWDVPLMVTRGYSSLSFLAGAAEAIRACGKPAYLYYLGDHDPSGIDIPRTIERDLRTMVGDQVEIHFERIAVLPWQVLSWNLPTRPTKPTDSRSRAFDGRSVEVDAIPPNTLRALVRNQVERHIDASSLERLLAVEAQERHTLREIANIFDGRAR